ncbi:MULTISPECIES: TolC family protein [Flavobacterium]|jgi:outer membrane protein TolC|uniref:TolC family protein n=1 Tax=Flavobacterium luminosum TaxID=2949086 RepID=A0ABT0TR98_9FLAO|nr:MULTISPECIES: TolC family protein [unclassified Flavobacterium]MCL9810023.1 TolC family protein [Flavobacterium sp. HXWNR70]MCU4189937.1 TolC family protein [Flavobacterium sp. HXWNR29]
MKNNLVTILLLILTISSYAQQKLTIEECYAFAEKNYPIAKQTNFLQQKTSFEIDALNKAKLPKIDINAQATYQSDVIGLPTSLPGVEPINKDQYRATLDVNQLLYNGGMINANTKLKEAQMLTQQQLVAVNLYQLKSRINYSYMMILLWQDQRELLLAKQSTIHSKIKEVKSGVKNGAMLPSSEQVLEAELLKLEQALTENTFQRIKELQNLAGLTSTTIKENSVLERPSTTLETNGVRPEMKFFELQQDQIEASKNIISKSNLPKLNAFGQAGYGNPGLNMLNNSFDDFYMVGLKLNWNVFDWNKSKSEKQALDIAKEIVTTEKETFETNNQMQLNELKSEISKLETIIKTDSQIILLRDKVVQSSDSQMRNGVITTSEYVTELNQLFDAKTNQKVHQTQLELAKINYQTIKGTH